LIEELAEKNKGLEADEQRALLKFEKEYQRKVRIIEETDRIKTELENQLALIMIENESLLKENNWRKEFNIANAKEIETYAKDIKILQRRIQELENENSNWRLKYENQELIKRNIESNPQFRDTYISIMTKKKPEDMYKGRLSHVVKTDSRFTDKRQVAAKARALRGATQIEHIKEETEEDLEKTAQKEDNLANELGELEGLDEDDFGNLLEERGDDEDEQEQEELFGQPDEDTQEMSGQANDGVFRASEFDAERFTVLDKNRSSHINIGLAPRNFKKTALPTIEEDEYYDPIKDKLKELKEMERLNKDRVIKELGMQREEDEKEEKEGEGEEEPDAKSESEKSEGKFTIILLGSCITLEAPFNKELEKPKEIKERVRATIALITKPHLKSAETQTTAKTEVVTIDAGKAMVIYDSFESEADTQVSVEGETQELNEPLKVRSPHRESTGELTYVKDTEEELKAGDVGRTLIKVQIDEGETMLIDRGKNKIVETSNSEVQTEGEYKMQVAEAPEKEVVAPVAAHEGEGSDDMGDDSDEEELEDVDKDEEQDLFRKLDSRQQNLGVIHEDEEDESDTFRTRPQKTEKEIEEEKKIQEISNKIKSKLDNQVRMSQFNGRGQSFLREKSIIDRISKIKNFDFLALRSKDNKYYKRVTRILERYNEIQEGAPQGMECFTEYIFKIDTSFKKHKRKILITKGGVYQLSKNFSVVNRIPLEHIKGLTLIKKSATVIAIHCPGSFDHLIEIIRRTEMVMFLMHMFDTRKLPKPKIYYADGLKTTTTKKNKVPQKKVLKFDPDAKSDVGKANLTLMTKLSSINFINSPKYGYLMKKAQGWFKEWSEKFCVITSVGLLYYNDPDQKPRNLFPIIDAIITPVDQKALKKKFVFQIKSFKWEITFAAKTEQDYIEWMDAFKKLQEETDKKKTALIEKGILDKKVLDAYKSKKPE
jgi:hypothetical protein